MSSPSNIDAISETQIIGITRDRNTAPNKFYAAVYDISGTTITQNTPLEISLTGGVFSDIKVLSSTRAIAIFSGSSDFNAVLLEIDGTTLTELDTKDLSSYGTSNFTQLLKISSTKSVVVYSILGTGDADSESMVIDTSSDAIVLGTPTTHTFGSTSSYAYGYATENGFIYAAKNKIGYFSVSGSTITEESTVNISGGTNYHDIIGITQVREGVFCLLYEHDTTTDYVYGNVFTLSGSTLTAQGSQTQIVQDAVFGGAQGHGAADIGQSIGIYVSTLFNDTDNPRAIIVHVNDEYDITVLANVDIGEMGDHPAIAMLPSLEKAVVVTQDSTTTPVDQTNMVVLQ